MRENPRLAGTLLLLSPGMSQIYYGDESARSLVIEGTEGDATLRSFMNWDALKSNGEQVNTLTHWQKLGRFRNRHPSVGAGVHKQLKQKHYVFSRIYKKASYEDKVVIGVDLSKGKKIIKVGATFADGTLLVDAYSNKEATVVGGEVELQTEQTLVLLEKK